MSSLCCWSVALDQTHNRQLYYTPQTAHSPCKPLTQNISLTLFHPIQNDVPPPSQYSGGQASEGQGGFYGSGGARKTEPNTNLSQTWQRPQMLALAADVTKVTMLMEEVERLEELYRAELDITSGGEASSAAAGGAPPSGTMIELKAKIQKMCTNPDVTECLNRLELNGEPVWGLSSEERDLITGFRNKVNDC